jgi:sterol desaturase/sphingolipid hydroxylase (fatty acid hydroxylase superfamily)
MTCRREFEFPLWPRRLGNIGIWLFNISAAAVIFPPSASGRPTALGFALGFLLLDLVSYASHRAMHAVPLLWRLHALHHSDPDVDWTTSVRHHPIEFLSATAVFWLVILVLHVPAAIVAAHGSAAFVLAIATHANSRWPQWLERTLRPVIITLDMHLAHHSIDPIEANVNFGQVLSCWDRLFGTFLPAGRANIFGVHELSRSEACRLIAMLATPWRIQ